MGPTIMGFEDEVERSFRRPCRRQVQADSRTHLIHRPARDTIPPRGGARVSSGTKRTLPDWVPMSAIGGKADVVQRSLMPFLAGCDRLTHPASAPCSTFRRKC